ncbi:hypothetical protein Cva_01317 [Caedimonas varicaedens]|uniref:Uncharacterized protein n=1 Tax=Caedimonas varicaedens TaxID=1629334 RepID=A0A0K8MEK1_9PROT|nr:hypothetical protein Cva_01317 [Caedimonas varicaedens]
MFSYTMKLILIFYSLYAFSSNLHASNDAEFDFFVRLQALNLKTKEEFDKKTSNKKFMTKYLDEAMMLVKHREQTGSLDTLPEQFVMQQFDRAMAYISAKKKPLLERILIDLEQSDPYIFNSMHPKSATDSAEENGINCILYNCTVMRMVALACLPDEDINFTIDDLNAPCLNFLKEERIKPTMMMVSSLFNLKNQLDLVKPMSMTLQLEDKRNRNYFYKLLVCLDLADIGTFSEDPYNYSFWNLFSPDDSVNILDFRPFIGTQTISYAMLNNLSLLGASLDPQISAHGRSEYKGPFGVWKHDGEHNVSWNTQRRKLEETGLYNIVMNVLMDIYDTGLAEKNEKEQKKIFDFLFILMHEDSPMRTIAKNL